MKGVSVVTGAGGHVGYALVKELIHRGERPRLLLFTPREAEMFKDLDVDFVMADITNPSTLPPAFAGAKTVYHLAGLVEIGDSNSEAVFRVNVDGTQNVIAACKQAGVRRFVYVSSVDAMPPAEDGITMTEPSTFSSDGLNGAYAKSKAIASQAALNSASKDFEVMVCMPSACIGPYDFKVSSVGVMVRMVMKHSIPVTIEFGGYNFVDVRDVGFGLASCAEKGRSGECYLLTGEYCPTDQVIAMLSELTGHKVPKIAVPEVLADIGAPVAEMYYKFEKTTPLFTRYTMRKLVENGHFSCDKAARELDYRPRSAREALKDMIEWIEDNEEDDDD